MKLSELNKGDIFKFGNKCWDDMHKFHSLSMEEDGRYFICFFSMGYCGSNASAKSTSFTYRDEDLEVYIPKFYLSEQKRTKGMPCIPVSNMRHIVAGEVNPINISYQYCSHDKYWYDLIY